MMKDFAAFILSHGRPNNIRTFDTLRKHGYTGDIFIIIDDQDDKADEYTKAYGSIVKQFNKQEYIESADEGDITGDHRAPLFARNATFDIAKELGIKYFIQLDDDYSNFSFRFDCRGTYKHKTTRNLDHILEVLLDFYKNTPTTSLALAQGGDFIGGVEGTFAKSVTLKRKAMNSFLCSTERPFKFVGKLNDDVNTYVTLGSRGVLFFTFNHLSLQQAQTQKNEGGMTDIYLASGTYMKSFISVMMHPSSVKITMMGNVDLRIHHMVSWNKTCPKIIREEHKK